MTEPPPSYNPYSPPKTVVVDAAETVRARPLAVQRAIILMCVNIVLALIYVGFDWQYMASVAPAAFLWVYEPIAFGVMIWLLIKVAAGRNWARITWLVLEVITWPMSITELQQTAARTPVVAGVELLMLGLDLATIYLIFIAGRAYFAKQTG